MWSGLSGLGYLHLSCILPLDRQERRQRWRHHVTGPNHFEGWGRETGSSYKIQLWYKFDASCFSSQNKSGVQGVYWGLGHCKHSDAELQCGTPVVRLRSPLQTEMTWCLFNSDVESWLKYICWRERTNQTFKSSEQLIMGWLMLALGMASLQCSGPFLLLWLLQNIC